MSAVDPPVATSRTASLLPGLLLTAAVVALAFLLRENRWLEVLSPLILAILIGVVVRNTVGVPAAALPGMQFALRRLLRLGIVVLGLQLTLGKMMQVGVYGLATIVIGLASTYAFTLAAGRWLGVEPGLSRLIATGTAVCGASAVLAANAVKPQKDEDVAYAVAGVTMFGTLAMVLLPMLGGGLAPRDYGLWTGASIHEVAQVVAAGAQGGAEAAAFATIAKLTRVALLAPMILLMAAGSGRSGRAPFPWFVLGFLAMVALASSGLVPHEITQASIPLTQALLAAGLAAMGLQTDLGQMKARGLRPLLLGALASIFIMAITLALVLLEATF